MEILNDFSTSLQKAFDEIDPNWRNYNGLVICGTHTPIYHEEQIDRIKEVREKHIPFLGICFGHQMAAIQYARDVLGIEDATSEEVEASGTFVVKARGDGLQVGMHDNESYWNRYEVDYSLVPNFEKDKPSDFITCQFHPEYQSSKQKPHPLLVTFLNICKKQ